MRIRITQSRQDAIDGVDLTPFRMGRTYEVDAAFATYLVVCGCAEPTATPGPALVIRSEETMTTVAATPWPDVLAEVADEPCDPAEDRDPIA